MGAREVSSQVIIIGVNIEYSGFLTMLTSIAFLDKIPVSSRTTNQFTLSPQKSPNSSTLKLGPLSFEDRSLHAD